MANERLEKAGKWDDTKILHEKKKLHSRSVKQMHIHETQGNSMERRKERTRWKKNGIKQALIGQRSRKLSDSQSNARPIKFKLLMRTCMFLRKRLLQDFRCTFLVIS